MSTVNSSASLPAASPKARSALVRGYVSQLREHTYVSGTADFVGTGYETTFSIGLQHVQLSTGSPAAIKDGDDVAVAGQLSSNGIFYGSSYRNITRNIYPDRPSNGVYIFGVVALIVVPIILLLICGIILLTGQVVVIVPALFPGIALAFGLNGLRRADATRDAYRALMGIR